LPGRDQVPRATAAFVVPQDIVAPFQLSTPGHP
jgi:hypothetical protein